MTVRVAPLTGSAMAQAVPVLARLRIAVFRDWPYLYDGSLDYEQEYLAKFSQSPGAVIVAAFDGDEIVGAATASPMVGHADEFGEPFRQRGYDIAHIFYCGESVLLKDYRGHGVGHAFFDHREAHGLALGAFTHVTFCAVVRPDDHPLKPANYLPLDAFWTRRGYARVPGLLASFDWKDVDQPEKTPKSLQFWMKPL